MTRMEKLLILGETSRNRSTFGIPVLLDEQDRMYQKVQPRYNELLIKDSRFDFSTMRAFDFKLKRARGKQWPEPPSIGDTLVFSSPLANDKLCTGIVSYVHLGRKRSVGIIYLENWVWISNVVPDFTI